MKLEKNIYLPCWFSQSGGYDTVAFSKKKFGVKWNDVWNHIWEGTYMEGDLRDNLLQDVYWITLDKYEIKK
jgi:hypothetical protein